MGWINLAQDKEKWKAPVSTVMNFRVPGKFLSSCTIGVFTRMMQVNDVSIVSWQRIYNSLTVTSSHKFLHRIIRFLPLFCNCQLN
jgi:hypothetical protein